MKIIKYKYVLVILSLVISTSYMQAQMYSKREKSRVKPLAALVLQAISKDLLEAAENISQLSKLSEILDIEGVPEVLGSLTPQDMSKLLVLFVDRLVVKNHEPINIADAKLQLTLFIENLNRKLELISQKEGLSAPIQFDVSRVIKSTVKILEDKIDKGQELFNLLVEPGSEADKIERVRKLIAQHADVNVLNTDDKISLLMVATAQGYLEILKLLLKAGANVNAKDKNGYNSLIIAANLNYPRIANLLINSGIDVDVLFKNWTPLMQAVRKNMNKDTVKLLINAGANVNFKNKEGETPLILALKANVNEEAEADELENKLEIIRLLINAGVDVNVRDTYGETPLMIAIKTYNGDGETESKIETVKLLINAGADVNAEANFYFIEHGPDETTPLKAASSRGYEQIKELLIKAGAKK